MRTPTPYGNSEQMAKGARTASGTKLAGCYLIPTVVKSEVKAESTSSPALSIAAEHTRIIYHQSVTSQPCHFTLLGERDHDSTLNVASLGLPTM